MTDINHPITPPPEFLRQLSKKAPRCRDQVVTTIEEWVAQEVAREEWIATQAVHWGADQELEACIEWIRERPCTWTVEQLRAARRPNPKSQAEEALEALDDAMAGGHIITTSTAAPTIRAALERLRELDGNQ